MSKTRYGGLNPDPPGFDFDSSTIPSIEEMNRTRKAIRKFLFDSEVYYREAEYDHYSRFHLKNGLVIDLLAYESEYQESGDVFVIRPFFDPLFGASGSSRVGITNIDNSDFKEAMSEFIGISNSL